MEFNLLIIKEKYFKQINDNIDHEDNLTSAIKRVNISFNLFNIARKLFVVFLTQNATFKKTFLKQSQFFHEKNNVSMRATSLLNRPFQKFIFK